MRPPGLRRGGFFVSGLPTRIPHGVFRIPAAVGLFTRVVGGLRYAVTGTPPAWFGPSQPLRTADQTIQRGNQLPEQLLQNVIIDIRSVITIITDTPQFYVEKRRPLADYDALEGEPMWLR